MATARRRRRAKVAGSAGGRARGRRRVGIVIGVSASGGTSTAAAGADRPPVTSSRRASVPSTALSPSPSVRLRPPPAAQLRAHPALGLLRDAATRLGLRTRAPTTRNGYAGPLRRRHSPSRTTAGEHWSTLPPPGVNVRHVGRRDSPCSSSTANRGYLYGDGLFATTDGGVHWQRIARPGPGERTGRRGQTRSTSRR